MKDASQTIFNPRFEWPFGILIFKLNSFVLKFYTFGYNTNCKCWSKNTLLCKKIPHALGWPAKNNPHFFNVNKFIYAIVP